MKLTTSIALLREHNYFDLESLHLQLETLLGQKIKEGDEIPLTALAELFPDVRELIWVLRATMQPKEAARIAAQITVFAAHRCTSSSSKEGKAALALCDKWLKDPSSVKVEEFEEFVVSPNAYRAVWAPESAFWAAATQVYWTSKNSTEAANWASWALEEALEEGGPEGLEEAIWDEFLRLISE